jgi:hypothetical protein
MLILYENGREVCQLIGGEFPHEQWVAGKPRGLLRYSNLSLDPAVLIVGASGVGSLLPWMSNVLRGTAFRRNLELVSYDALTKKGRRSQMFDCLLTGISFPALDKSSKADASLKISILPERLIESTQSATMGISLAKGAGSWKASEFILDIPGIPGLSDAIQAVAAINLIQVVKKYYTGDEIRPENMPASLEHGSLNLGLLTSKSRAVTDWASEEIQRETRSPKPSLEGTLTYLSGKKPLMTLEFSGIGLVKVISGGAMPRLELFYESVRLGA